MSRAQEQMLIRILRLVRGEIEPFNDVPFFEHQIIDSVDRDS